PTIPRRSSTRGSTYRPDPPPRRWSGPSRPRAGRARRRAIRAPPLPASSPTRAAPAARGPCAGSGPGAPGAPARRGIGRRDRGGGYRKAPRRPGRSLGRARCVVSVRGRSLSSGDGTATETGAADPPGRLDRRLLHLLQSGGGQSFQVLGGAVEADLSPLPRPDARALEADDAAA